MSSFATTRPARAASRPLRSARNVFLNCPFDDAYLPLFHAAVFTIVDCGFVPRCTLELEDASEVRIDKICRIIGECQFGVHDLSRTDLDRSSGLPRFNMPLELGIFIGAKRFGGESQARKSCLILDVERYRYQKFISDIAGQDIRAHGGEVGKLIGAVRDWLRTITKRKSLPGGLEISRRFLEFKSDFPDLCSRLQVEPKELTFSDLAGIAAAWVDERSAGSLPSG